MNFLRPSSRWNWSWGFAFFIALPALVLAALGLRAVRAERLEQEQQMREQEVQVARLFDAAILNKLNALEAELKRDDISDATRTPDGIYRFALDRNNALRFRSNRIYFGDSSAPGWSLTIEAEIERAQSLENQNRAAAANVYRQIAQAEPRLQRWADLKVAWISYQVGEASALADVTNAEIADSEATTPSGLPLPLIACAYFEHVRDQDRKNFAALTERSLENLRRGRWWLNFDERSFYDSQLRQMLQQLNAQPVPDDQSILQLPPLETILRRAAPAAGAERACSFESAQNHSFLVCLSPRDGDTRLAGFAVSRDAFPALFDPALSALLSGQLFQANIRNRQQESVWGRPLTKSNFTEPLSNVRGLEVTFAPIGSPSWIDQKQLLWLGFILLLVVMMIAGLAMTARLVRREVELNRMQNEFIAAVSHEFKSPIASIRLLIERMINGRVRDSRTTADYCSAIDHESERLERLVNRLLEWQQIQAGRRQYTFRPVDPAEIAKTAVAQFRPLADAKQIVLKTNLDDRVPKVNADELALSDAIENLIDNAIKYSPAGRTVWLQCASIDHQVSIQVRDEGLGIAADELPHIFDRFYRGRRGDLSNVHGTGLGLALVRATAEAHGGNIEVTSEPDRGSCFSLRLPIWSEPPASAGG